jgi:hypothetical protein
MKQTQTPTPAKTQAAARTAVIEQLVKQNVATVKKMNGLGWSCFCCVGC